MDKMASVTNLKDRIAKRDAKRFREKVEAHVCVLERRARSEDVAVVFSSDEEQHALHQAFNEPTCAACSVCQRNGSAKRVVAMTVAQQARWRGHWARMVAFSRLLKRDHVRAGLEILVQYQSSRGMDEMLYVVPKLAVSEEDCERLRGLGWKLEGGKWFADYEPLREVAR